MSATNKTTYLDLPQFIGTDVPSWLGDFNGAMEKIDTGYNNVDIKAGQAASTANSASSKADINTQSITSINAELKTLKNAVQNYDNILNFKAVTCIPSPNNLKDSSSMFMTQNTNKTLASLKFNATMLYPLANPSMYVFTWSNDGGTTTFYDLFTIEDNCFNLNQTALPRSAECLTVGVMTTRNDSTRAVARLYVRAWYDGATTHIGAIFSNEPSTNITMWMDGTVFLSGSVISLPDPEDTE
jgi:hypothetical protein